MKKTLYVIIFVLFCCSYLYAENDKPIITVLDFESSGIAEAEMQATISILSSALFKTDFFTVIDVSQRETVLKELEFSLSGCSDESCMLEVGRMLSAEAIVVGSIGRIGSKYVLSVKMLETETAKTLSTADGLYPDIDTLLENIYQVADELSKPYKSELSNKISDDKDVSSQEEAASAPEQGLDEINIPAIATLSGGIVSAGAGAYFLAVSLPLIFDYLGAKSSYETATGTADDISSLWTAYETARQSAVTGEANLYFILGASCTIVGAALTAVSIILFSEEEPDSGLEIAFLPGYGKATLLFSLNGEEVLR